MRDPMWTLIGIGAAGLVLGLYVGLLVGGLIAREPRDSA